MSHFRDIFRSKMTDSEPTVQSGQLSYVSRNCEAVPIHLAKKYGQLVTRIDLSDNSVRSLSGLEQFTKLNEVVLDKNGLTDDDMETLPTLRGVETLSLNKNQITDLDKLLNIIRSRLPDLTYLSLLGNEACPDQLSNSDKDEDDYRRYRLYILYNLPKLKFLDFSPFRESDRQDAAKKGPYLKVARPSDECFKANRSNASQETKSPDFHPLPAELREDPDPKATFGKCRYIYYGRHSEGNRFIRNNDL